MVIISSFVVLHSHSIVVRNEYMCTFNLKQVSSECWIANWVGSDFMLYAVSIKSFAFGLIEDLVAVEH